MSLAQDWIKSKGLQLKFGRIDDSFDVPLVEMVELCSRSPRLALNVVYEILSCEPSSEIVKCLGAGPLEDILYQNCEEFMDELIERSRTEPLLKLCMRSVNLDNSECTRAKEYDRAIGLNR